MNLRQAHYADWRQLDVVLEDEAGSCRLAADYSSPQPNHNDSDSDPKTSPDDLLLLVAGALNDDQERVRSSQAEGFDPIATDKSVGTYPERLALSRQKIEAFTQLFLDEVFTGYCNGDRGILRERANRLRSAARFYYLSKYARRDQMTEDSDESSPALVNA